MLLGAPNQLLLLVALVGQINLYIYVCVCIRSRLWNPIEIHGGVWKNIPMQPVLRVLSVLPATAIDAAVALDLHSNC